MKARKLSSEDNISKIGDSRKGVGRKEWLREKIRKIAYKIRQNTVREWRTERKRNTREKLKKNTNRKKKSILQKSCKSVKIYKFEIQIVVDTATKRRYIWLNES